MLTGGKDLGVDFGEEIRQYRIISRQTLSVARRQVATAADLATGHDHGKARSAGDIDYCELRGVR